MLAEEDEKQMTAVLRCVVKMFKANNKGIQFQYFNGKECALVPIPNIERDSYRNFKEHKYHNNKMHFMEQILEHIGADCGDVEEQKNEAATLVSTYLVKKYRGSFLVAAKFVGVNISNRMSEYAAGVMWTAAGIPEASSCIIIRHITAAFGSAIQVPISSITNLGSGFVLPRFGTYIYEKEAGKKKEVINYWVSNLSEIVSRDIERVLNKYENKGNHLTFGYPSMQFYWSINSYV